jgi:hypothetical protein
VVLTISAEPRPAQMSVVHGVPGLPVGFYVNGTLTLPDFPSGTVTDTDPSSLPEGEYDIDVVGAGGDLANPAVDGKVIVPAGANATTSRTWPWVADRFNQGLAVPNTPLPGRITAPPRTPGTAQRWCTGRACHHRPRGRGLQSLHRAWRMRPAHRTSDEQWLATIATNLNTAFFTVRAACRTMQPRGGSIALVSSVAARLGLFSTPPTDG